MTLTAVLFVGGQSTRMGRDKALVEIGGEPLWSRQVRLLRALQPAQILISCREETSWCPADALMVLDDVSGQGPLGGLVAALSRMTTSHLLALAIDLPKMNEAVLRFVLDAAKPGCGVVPEIAGRFEPLCAVYAREALPLARAALQRRELSLQSLMRALVSEGRAVSWPVPPELRPAFLNVNSPADLDGV